MHNAIQTVRGPVAAGALGLILPHEHLFTDLRGPLAPGYATADSLAVERTLAPHLAAAHAAGVTAIFECSTVGVGRNVAILRHLAERTPVQIIAPTGVYREQFVPPALRETSIDGLAGLWVRELTEGIEGTGVRAGFIKIALSDGATAPIEVRNLRAAARASLATGAAVASHTITGAQALEEMDILEAEGLPLERFVWVHAGVEPDGALHARAARRGAYLEFDTVGAPWLPQPALADAVVALVGAGHAHQVLLSHDAGWYDPSQPDGLPQPGGIRGFTALVERFLPALRARGIAEETLRLMTATNPARAFALP